MDELERIFPGASEIAQLCRALDWASTPLGPATAWPVALKTVVRTLLGSRQPMVLFWGPDLIQIYNEAYRPSLGEGGRHPEGLGAPARVFWDEIWSVVGPQVDQVLGGHGATWNVDQLVPITRNGRREDAYWTYSYGPAYDDAGEIAGVLIITHETTERFVAERAAQAHRAQLAQLLERQREREHMMAVASRLGRLGAWRYHPETGVHWSDEICDIHEVPRGTQPTPEQAFDFFPDHSKAVLIAQFQRCVDEGLPFDEELELHTATGRDIWVRLIGEALRDDWGELQVVHGAMQEITEQKDAERAIRESDRRFKEMAEALPLVIWSADPSGSIDYQTRAILDFTGLSAAEMNDTGWLSTLHPDDVDATTEAWSDSIATGDPYDIDFRIRGADGAYHWFSTRARPFRDENGTIVRWYGSSADIHDLVTLRERAEALAGRLSTTLQSITDAFYLIDRTWSISFINDEAERQLGRSRDDLIGADVWHAFPGLIGSELEPCYRRAMRTGEPESLVCFYPPLARWLDLRIFPSTEGLAVTFRDVTAERQAAQRIQEQAALLDRTQDAVLVRDLDHTITFWNAAAENMYGWTADQAIGSSIRELLYRDPGDFDRATAQVIETGEWNGEIEHHTHDGSVLTVEGRWSLVRDEAGQPYRILAVNTDVTDRKRLLAQFLRAQRLESIGTLAGGIAHDLNNVLAPILMSIGLLRMDIDDPELRETLDTIETSALHGADMVKQVLGFARGYDRRDLGIDLPQILGDLARVVRDTFPKNISFQQEISPDLWPLSGDPTQLHQVLINLLVNARDALPNGGTLAVSVENVTLDAHYAAMSHEAVPGDFVRLTVVDSGTGMPPTVLEKVFDPFFTTKPVGKGTGLGLSTVRSIVKSYGGFVNVYSVVGSGTTFRVYLPASAEEHAGEASRPPNEVQRGAGELILVVDDEAAVREITRQTLEAFGYRVITATDGAHAIAQFSQHIDDVQLVLTDMVMPIMDGPATIRALRRISPTVRIIGASGLGTNGAVARAADIGVRTFLPKPYTAESLLAAVRACLDR